MSLLHRTRHDRPDHDDDHGRSTDPASRRRHRCRRATGPSRGTWSPTPTSPSRPRERTWTFAPGQLISLIVGIGFVAVGLRRHGASRHRRQLRDTRSSRSSASPTPLARPRRGRPRRAPDPRRHRCVGPPAERHPRCRHGDRRRAHRRRARGDARGARPSRRTSAGLLVAPRRAGRAGSADPAGVALAPGDAQRRAESPTTDATVAAH